MDIDNLYCINTTKDIYLQGSFGQPEWTYLNFEFNKCTAQIVGLIVEKSSGFLGLGASDTAVIPWCKIECIGEDTILVKFSSSEFQSFCRKRTKKFFE